MGKIRQHLKDNKRTYLVGIGGVVVGGVGAVYLLKTKPGVYVRPIQALTYKSTQTLEVFVEALGDPGNVIQEMETGTIYASQGQAAKALGLNPCRISDHLNGRTPNVKGHTFSKLGKATVVDV